MIGRVCGTGSYLPIRTVSNDELSHVMETSDEWIRERTGIRFRHVALEETTSDMAAEAAARALKNGEVNPIRCEHCDYCKHTRILKAPIWSSELIGEV